MSDRPNLVFIMPDQLRHDFLACYGADFIDTPHIDALCDQGVRYSRAYSAHPVCVAARASLLSGMDAIKTGVLDNAQYLRPDYLQCGLNTWPELLAERGYTTVATGKMHFYPWEKRFGFDRRLIAEDKLWGFIQDDYYHFLQERGHKKTSFVDEPAYHQNHMALVSPLPWECSVDHWVGDQTARWIEAYEGESPFAVMVGFPGPHSPYDPAEEYATFQPADMPEPIPAVEADNALMRAPGARPDGARRRGRGGGGKKTWYAVDNPNPPTRETYLYQRACYTGLVKQIDLEVGRITQALERAGKLDDTVIVFSSDHGDYLGDHGLSGKGTYYEASCHVPMIVRDPRRCEGSVCDDLVTLTDVTATLLSLAGVDVPSYMDSRPLPGIGLQGAEPREQIFGFLRSGAMLLDREWKFVRYPGGVHLFNLRDDPTEQRNRATDPTVADICRRLDAELWTQVTGSMDEGNFAQRICPTTSHSSSSDFGRVGYERRYPMPWQEIYQ